MDPAFDSVLLLAFGGPTRSEDVRPYLDEVLRGRPVGAERYEEVVRHYEQVGGASPLLRLTEQQAAALRRRLAEDGPDLPVYVGMRHWHPFIADTLERMAADGRRRAAGIILAPHPSDASREAYLRSAAEAQRRVGARAPTVDFAGRWHDHPGFIEAIAARLRAAAASLPQDRRAGAALLCTAHSIPEAMARRSDYVEHLVATAGLAARAADFDAWWLAYQSRSGGPDDPWLEPDVSEVIHDLARGGRRDVIVAPIGFVSDHVEVLYDLDIQARAAAEAAGIGFVRAPTVGDHPAFIGALADLVRGLAGPRA